MLWMPFPVLFYHWDKQTCALYGNKIKTNFLTFSLTCFSLSLFTQTLRVPVGATVAHHNFNDLIVIHGIPLQQRNMGTPDRIAQYEHCRRNKHNLYKLYIYHCSLVFWCCRNWSKLEVSWYNIFPVWQTRYGRKPSSAAHRKKQANIQYPGYIPKYVLCFLITQVMKPF